MNELIGILIITIRAEPFHSYINHHDYHVLHTVYYELHSKYDMNHMSYIYRV